MRSNASLANSNIDARNQTVDFFIKNGYCVIDLENPGTVLSAKKKLDDKLRTLANNKDLVLEKYHTCCCEKEEHIAIQATLSELLRKEHFCKKIALENIDWFKEFIGQDLNIQEYPYLRIARPTIAEDNIGYHRDTWYGSSPFEISIVVPFTDMISDNTLSIDPGSHAFPEGAYNREKVQSIGVEKGSVQHKLGFPYMANFLTEEVKTLRPVPVKVGQALIFNLAVLHGQVVNKSNYTRVSTDFRLVNANANISMGRSVHGDYYHEFIRSPLSKQVQAYTQNNPKQ